MNPRLALGSSNKSPRLAASDVCVVAGGLLSVSIRSVRRCLWPRSTSTSQMSAPVAMDRTMPTDHRAALLRSRRRRTVAAQFGQRFAAAGSSRPHFVQNMVLT